MKILVSGGAGFLGSNICVRLLNKGHEVICLDNLSSGHKQNIMEFMFNPKFSFILHDITEPFTSAYVDAIVHCAVPDMRDHLHFLKTCTQGTFNVAGIARRNCARLVYVSSFEWYGNNRSEDIPIEENSVGLHQPENDRAAGFQIAESILNNYKKLDIRILRLFDFYGPKMSENNFLGNLFKKIVSDENILLEEHQNQLIRSCYIDDVLAAISCAVDIKKFEKGPINVGTNQKISLGDFIFKALQYSNSKSEIQYSLNEKPYIIGKYPLIEKAERVLKWKDRTSYDVGIQKTIKFLKEGPTRDYL